MRIHIFGAAGSGTSTLGSILSEEFNWPHFDADDYYWKKTDPPYTQKNEIPERHKLLLKDIEGHDSWIMTGSMDSWCEPFKSLWNLAFFIECNAKQRVKRLREREFSHFGERIHAGGDMYDEHEFFIKWVEQYEDGSLGGRSLHRHEEFINQLSCPVERIINEGDLENLKLKSINHILKFKEKKNE